MKALIILLFPVALLSQTTKKDLQKDSVSLLMKQEFQAIGIKVTNKPPSKEGTRFVPPIKIEATRKELADKN